LNDLFNTIARRVSHITGTAWSFLTALLIVIVWGITGPIFKFSDTWQLVINTGTTIVTFLMVFLIQNTQNRDSLAMQLKLDELLRSIEGARNSMIDLESLTDAELSSLEEQFRKIREDCGPDYQPGPLYEKLEQVQHQRRHRKKAKAKS
jgi:low affinity Fe/Cu permease